MSTHLESSVRETIRLLSSESYRLMPNAADTMRAIDMKVQAEGADALTPSEAIYVATLISERLLLQFRERLMMAAQP